MAKTLRSTALYPHPFSKAYWRDAASELKSTRMLVITALLVALRIALKPLAIPIMGPQLSIQTAMLATALGAMVFGPIVSIPAAIISDTIGFIIWPTGDYFLPFVLTEIASTMIYSLFLYRSKVTPFRVMLSRFCICFFVNMILQQGIMAWQYVYMGTPEKAMDALMGITSVARVFKNLAFFPIESVVLTLFLKFLLPITQRLKITYTPESDLRITKKQVAALVCLTIVGALMGTGYLAYRYSGTSRSADYSVEERVEANKAMTELVLEKTDDWDSETVVCIVDSAYRPLFGKETDYTVAVYTLNDEAFKAAQAENLSYSLETIWQHSKSKAEKAKDLDSVAVITFTMNEDTKAVSDFQIGPAKEKSN